MMVFRHCVTKLNVADFSGRGKASMCHGEGKRVILGIGREDGKERRELRKSRKIINRVWTAQRKKQRRC